MKKILAIALVAIVSFSCEKVIDIPLNEADQKVVVEGQLFDIPHESFVKVSKTGPVYENEDFETLDNVSVIVTDNVGGTFTFLEDPLNPGTYIDTSFVTQPNTIYYLQVTTSEGQFTATSETFSDVAFDSLDYVMQVGGFGADPNDTSFFTFQHFSDNGAETNYYNTIVFRNDTLVNEYLNNDQLFNGNFISQPFFADNFGPKDTCTAVLVSMDEPNYDFKFSLQNNSDGGPFSATPANPVSNIEGGALGFFGAYVTDIITIIYP